MRWLKHLSMAHDDVAIATILEEMGPEAYGIYWLLLEHFAGVMEKDCEKVPELVHSVISWSNICHCSARKFAKFVDRASNLRLISVNTTADLRQYSGKSPSKRLQICVPKLLKYRDEYSKKSGVSPDKLPPRERAERETEREQKITAASAANVTIVERPEAPVPEPKAAAAAAAEEAPGKFPKAAHLVRAMFAGTDGQLIRQIVACAEKHKPAVIDDELCDALSRTYRGKEQRSAALWLSTIPAFFAVHARGQPANGPSARVPAAEVCPDCGGEGKILSPECDTVTGDIWTDWPEERIWLPCPRCHAPPGQKRTNVKPKGAAYAATCA